jgi:hypothetical protein
LLTTKRDVIENYIKQFRDFGPQVVDCFSHGMCYQFMTILRKRFGPFCTTPVYDEVINHFATEIDGRIYDITGDITDDTQYHWKRWTTVCAEDHKHANRICRDCVDKVPSDTLICKYCDNSFYDEILNTYLCGLDNKPVDLDTPCTKGVECDAGF